MSDPNDDRPEEARRAWERRRKRRRRKLRSNFQDSRRRHDPPPDPEEWEPTPMWRHIWQTLWDNPTGLVLVAIMIAVLLYLLFPPEWLGFLPF